MFLIFSRRRVVDQTRRHCSRKEKTLLLIQTFSHHRPKISNLKLTKTKKQYLYSVTCLKMCRDCGCFLDELPNKKLPNRLELHLQNKISKQWKNQVYLVLRARWSWSLVFQAPRTPLLWAPSDGSSVFFQLESSQVVSRQNDFVYYFVPSINCRLKILKTVQVSAIFSQNNKCERE